MPSKAPPPGILNFWDKNTKPPPKTDTVNEVNDNLQPVKYIGQLYTFVLNAPSEEKAAGAFGALLKAILTGNKAKEAFERQGIFINKPLGSVTTISLGDFKLYARAGSLNTELGAKMAVDRLAFALMECRRDPEVNKFIDTIGLRIVTNERTR